MEVSKLSPAEFTEKYLKVDQPMMTEVMSVSLKWSDRDTAREMLDRLLQRYLEFVVAERKKAILQGARQTMVQELALCASETERLQEHIKELENALAQNKDLTAPELDGALLARRNDLPQTES